MLLCYFFSTAKFMPEKNEQPPYAMYPPMQGMGGPMGQPPQAPPPPPAPASAEAPAKAPK